MATLLAKVREDLSVLLALLDVHVTRGGGTSPWVAGIVGIVGALTGALVSHLAAKRRDDVSQRLARAGELRKATRDALIAAYSLHRVLRRLGRRTSGAPHDGVPRDDNIDELRTSYYEMAPPLRAEVVGIGAVGADQPSVLDTGELLLPVDLIRDAAMSLARIESWERLTADNGPAAGSAVLARLVEHSMTMWWVATEACISKAGGPDDGVHRVRPPEHLVAQYDRARADGVSGTLPLRTRMNEAEDAAAEENRQRRKRMQKVVEGLLTTLEAKLQEEIAALTSPSVRLRDRLAAGARGARTRGQVGPVAADVGASADG